MNSIDKEAKEKAKRALVINKVKANAVPSRNNANKAIQPTHKTRS